MSEFDTEDFEDTLPKQDEITALKARADLMGISYHPSIGVEKLRAKINEVLEGTPSKDTTEHSPVMATPTQETEGQKKARKRREASELVRVRVSCMNPAKNEWDGEIFSAGNSQIGTFTKYVPFNADDGWHVPRILLNQMQDRQCQIFVTKTDDRGNKVRQGKLIKEFAIEVLPALTTTELHELAQRQAMSKSVS